MGGDVTLNPGAATFVTKDAGIGITINYTGYDGLGGTNVSRFALFSGGGITTANITPKALTAVSLVGAVTKTYNGNNAVTNLTSGNYSITGFVGAEGATIGVTSGTYDNGKDVVNNPAGSPVTSTSLVLGDYTANGGTLLSNYDLSAVTGVSATGNIGAITSKALTAVGLVGAVTKTYNGNNAVINLTSGNYSITGFIGGEGATVGVTNGTYDNGKDVVNNPAGSPVTSASLVLGDYTANGGTLLSNYDLSAVTGVSATGNIGAITSKALTAVGLVGAVTKVYNGNNAVTNLTSGNYSITGFVGAEGATVGVTNGTYDNGKDVVNNPAGSPVTSTSLVLGDYTANGGTLLSNYDLSAVTGVSATGNIGAITTKALTAVGLVGAVTKTYNGNNAVINLTSGNYSITGFVGAEGATVGVTNGTYDNGKDVVNNPAGSPVTSASLVSGDYTANGGTLLSNYDLSAVTGVSATGNIGAITSKALTAVSLVGAVTKVYNGNNAVTNLTSGNYSITGFIGGEGATVGVTGGTYDNGKDVVNNPAGSPVTSTSLVLGDYTANGGTLLSNYDLSAVTGVSATGNIGAITSKALTAVGLVGAVTKVYNGNNAVTNLTSGNYSITGFVGAEGATVGVTNGTYDNGKDVVNNPAGSPVTSASLVLGDYTANGGTLLSNYDLSAVIGVSATGNIGAITPKALIVVADALAKVYGALDPALTYAASGFQSGDTVGSVLTGVLSRVVGESVGNYAIGQNTLLANSNYIIAYTGANLGITPAVLHVVADPQSKIFGAIDPALTYMASGFQFSDTAGTVLSGLLTRAPGESVLGGPYDITQGTLAAGVNYTLGYTHDHLLITDAASSSVLGFNAGQVIYNGVINNDYYYRPGNFWHIALNYNNADPGFDVLRGTNEANTHLSRGLERLDPSTGGVYYETWSFPQESEKVHGK